MSETEKEFPTEEVLSLATGVLVCEFSKMHALAEWMSGEPVWTHQLIRVMPEAQKAMLAYHPKLAPTIAEAKQVDETNWPYWRAKWIDRHGPTMFVRRMTNDQHASIDPMSEAVERIHPDKIITIGDGK